jgi:hypothetical protein
MNDALKFGLVLGVGVLIGRAMSDINITVNPTLHVAATVPVAVDSVSVRLRDKQPPAKTGIFGTKKP